jgi:DNA-binding NtrC family response regulator
VPLLIDHFLARLAAGRGSRVTGLNREALDRLLSYSWPGNVRELENLIERMVTLADETVLTVDDLPAKLLADTDGRPVPDLALALPDEPDEAPGAAPAEAPAVPAPDGGPAESQPRPQVTEAPAMDPPPDGVDFNALVSAYEIRLISWALEAAGGVRNQAAKLLNLNRTTLVEKMRKKGLLADQGDALDP